MIVVEALLDRTTAAQRSAMAAATHRLFIATTSIATFLFLVVVTLNEVPLRRSFGSAEQRPVAVPDH